MSSSGNVSAESGESGASARPVEITVRAGRYYRNTRYLMALLFVGFGLACIRDGFFKYPRENEAAKAKGQPAPHADLDAPLNRIIGTCLPPLGLLVLGWTLYNSRGIYRLSNSTLYIPGHPAIPLASIRKIDKRLWERKGIAYIEYEAPESSTPGRFKLDDFVYGRDGTDDLFDAIESHVKSLR